jgi:hypothetical protein
LLNWKFLWQNARRFFIRQWKKKEKLISFIYNLQSVWTIKSGFFGCFLKGPSVFHRKQQC